MYSTRTSDGYGHGSLGTEVICDPFTGEVPTIGHLDASNREHALLLVVRVASQHLAILSVVGEIDLIGLKV